MKITDKKIKNKLEELNIIYSDVTDETDKKDIMTALNAIEKSIKNFSDEKLLEHIKEIQKAKVAKSLFKKQVK